MSSSQAKTSASGGSAESQAADLDPRVWTARRGMSFAIRAVMVLLPLLAGFFMVGAAIRVLPRPNGIGWAVGWVMLLVAVSTSAAMVTRRFTVRLSPAAAVFKMTLVFPDQAPPRFRAAIRAGTGRQLSAHAAAGMGPHQAAAEHMLAMVAQLSRHDRLTRGHSERVRAYAVMLGDEIGLSRSELDKLNWAALIHDIGKIEVPGKILNKDGRPTADEWRILRGHPGAAAEYVEPLRPWLGDWVDAATQHHERYDGGGYPHGLAGSQISLAGRIVAIADAFDVMTAARSYKKPLPAQQARAELLNNAGTQFDPGLVRAFLRISVGRMERVVGPLAWLSQFPEIVRTPLVAVANGTQTAVAAGVVTAAAVVGVVSPTAAGDTIDATPAVERVIEDIEPEAQAVAPTSTGLPAPTSTDTGSTTSWTTPTPTASGVSTPVSHPSVTSTVTSATVPIQATTTSNPAATTTSTNSTPTTTNSTTTTTTSPPSVGITNDAATVTSLSGVVVSVTVNDVFGHSAPDAASLQLVSPAGRGTTTITGVTIKYRPNPGETSGTDTFAYRICSNAGACGTATVTITLDLDLD